MPHTLRRLGFCCLLAASFTTYAAPEDCIENGGSMLCVPPEVGPWQYSLCDDAGAYTSRYAAWCRAMGGTWKGLYASPSCEGGTPLTTEGQMVPMSIEFERQLRGACLVQADWRGWLSSGSTVSSAFCWSGGPVFKGDIEVGNFVEIMTSGATKDSNGACSVPFAERILGHRSRKVECPANYRERTGRSGKLECYRPCLPEQGCCKGQQYTPANQCCTQEGVQQKWPIVDLQKCPNRTSSGQSPRVNGCGAEGSDLGSFAQQFGSADFRPHCNRHDECYDTCLRNKAQCDETFGSDLLAACNAAYRDRPVRADACRRVARTYILLVQSSWGLAAYNQAQQRVCQCCP